MDKYDIIYSITCHESPECVVDLLKNIRYFNKGLKYLVILQINEYLHGYFSYNIRILNDEMENLIINNYVNNNKLYTFDLIEAHFNNFEIIRKTNFEYFCLLASNCLFKKEITKKYLDNLYLDKEKNKKERIIETEVVGKQLENFEKNYIINDLFRKQKMPLFIYQHESALYKKNIFEYIYNYCKIYDLKNKVTFPIPFEESIFPTLEYKQLGFLCPRFCKVFWDMPHYTPTLEQVKEEEMPIVKRVPRIYNNNIRKYIRENNNNYKLKN
jgi:hypothetical protein